MLSGSNANIHSFCFSVNLLVKVKLSYVEIHQEHCTCILQREQCDATHPGRCDFSVSICNFWSNDIDDDFDWTLHKGITPSLGTGPSVDHTKHSESGTRQLSNIRHFNNNA